MHPKNRLCRSKFSLFISRFFHVQKFKSSTFARSVPSSTQPHVRIMRALFHAQSPKFSQALSSLFGLPAAHRRTRFFCGKSQGGCSVPPACCSRPANLSPPKIKKFRPSRRMFGIFGGGRWIRTTEVTDNRFTVCPLWPLGNSPIFTCALKRKLGAGRRTRTPDLLITNQLLYQLSYTSIATAGMIITEQRRNVNRFCNIFLARRSFYSPAAPALCASSRSMG